MNFLLVNPPIVLDVAKSLRSFLHLEPLSLEIVAGGISPKHSVKILDLGSVKNTGKEFERAVSEFRPDVIGFTAYSNQAGSVKQLADRAKRLRPQAMIIAGGIHATLIPQDFKLPGTIDMVIRGEGGSAMRDFVARLEKDSSPPNDERFLLTEAEDFDEKAKSPPPTIPQYSEVPAPRRNLVDRLKYFCIRRGEPGEKLPALFPQTAAVRTSVGCPNRCNFCVVHYLANGKYRQRKPEDVVEEIASIAEDHIYFVDDEMFINVRRCERIAEMLIERGIRKQYISWARADTVCKHPELFALWKKAGLSVLYIGLESMDEETLRLYNKGVGADTNRRAVELLREMGIGLHAAFMVKPDFSVDDFMQLRETVKKVTPAEVSFTVFSPPPGTPLWEERKDEFICPDPHAFYDCMHTLLPTRLPLNKFYAQFALLYLHAVRRNPWRMDKVKVPLRDLCRFFYRGAIYGKSLRGIYKDYQR